MASNESDFLLRQEEIDILKSIYIDELIICNSKDGFAESIEIVLHPATAGQAHQQYVCLTLLLHIPEQYPHVEPKISIKNPRGISDEFVDSLKKSLEVHATENLGNQVLFSLIQHANDSLTYNNTPSCDCAVCLTGFQEEDDFTKTECYHYFHISCLERYIDVCTKDYDMELKELQKDGSVLQQTTKQLQIVCPLCRENISYESKSQNETSRQMSVDDEIFIPDDSMKRWQKRMKDLYKKQEDKGGIIDVEAESNRFLLDISTTVTTAVSTLKVSDDGEKCSERERERNENKRGHTKSRRENYNKYGSRSKRGEERWQIRKESNTRKLEKSNNIKSGNNVDVKNGIKEEKVQKAGDSEIQSVELSNVCDEKSETEQGIGENQKSEHSEAFSVQLPNVVDEKTDIKQCIREKQNVEDTKIPSELPSTLNGEFPPQAENMNEKEEIDKDQLSQEDNKKCDKAESDISILKEGSMLDETKVKKDDVILGKTATNECEKGKDVGSSPRNTNSNARNNNRTKESKPGQFRAQYKNSSDNRRTYHSGGSRSDHFKSRGANNLYRSGTNKSSHDNYRSGASDRHRSGTNKSSNDHYKLGTNESSSDRYRSGTNKSSNDHFKSRDFSANETHRSGGNSRNPHYRRSDRGRGRKVNNSNKSTDGTSSKTAAEGRSVTQSVEKSS